VSTQDQFLDVINRDEAERRFHDVLDLRPLGEEAVALDQALGRILSRDIVSPVDVPSFDRSNYDGFAVRAADTYRAGEEEPRRLELLAEVLATGVVPQSRVAPGTAVAIATGGMLPRGADAVLMVEHGDVEGSTLIVRRAVTPGFGVAFAGTDICLCETVLRRGELMTSRETGVLAALGLDQVTVYRQVRVAILSTGDELIPPGAAMQPGQVYDSNARILADAIRELGGVPLPAEIVPDDLQQLEQRLAHAVENADVILLSGGTSKGAGDLSYRVVRRWDDPGIVAHGVALKPGKPICLAATGGKPVVVLPGFPTSAIFTFHEFVAPVILRLGGRRADDRPTRPARLAVKVNSEIGRTEYLLVGLVRQRDPAGRPAALVAYPMGKGSGSVTTFSRADGFITIGRHEELIEAGTEVAVQLIGESHDLADLVVMGSHCVGLDFLLGRLQDLGFHTKALAVGSSAGLAAVGRGQCDLAGIHLMDPETGQYNRPLLPPDVQLIPGYGRRQGIVFRPGDPRFDQRGVDDAVAAAVADPECVMVNRNQGSGTRILIDRMLQGARPEGYAVQARNHNAVAAAIAQSRADWGVAIQSVARDNGLGFLPVQDEQYDFVVPDSRIDNPAIDAFQKLLAQEDVRRALRGLGLIVA